MRAELAPDAGAIEPDWWELWRRDPAATPFQSPAWLVPWREQFGGSESFVLTVRQGGRLMGLLPLFRHQGRLLLWGAGVSDWLDGVFDPGLDAEALTAALAKLAAPLDFFQLRKESPLLAMRPPPGWDEQAGAGEKCVGMALPARLSAKMWGNLRYYRRRAARAGAAEPELAGAGCLDELVELHGRRWGERHLPGVLADPRVLAWHRRAAPQLEAAGLLRLYVLRMEGRTVAALYVLAAKQRAFYYIGGFDPDFSTLGLGTIMVGHAISEAEREGALSFDFLRGSEAYKYRWGASDQPTYARFLQPPALTG